MKHKNKRAYKNRVSIPPKFNMPKAIVNKLHEKLSLHRPDFLFQETTALFFLNLVFKNTVKNWKYENLDQFTPLSSKILRKYSPHYNLYFEYFLKTGLLEMKERRRFPGVHECRRYRLSSDVRQSIYSDKAPFATITNERFNDAPTDLKQHEMSETFLEAKHLSNWYNDKLTINYTEAIEHLQCTSSPDEEIAKKWFIESIKNNDYYGVRNTLTDNRMHSNLTNLPREMRQFLRYDGEDLVNFDIKCSQPFFLLGIIKGLIEKPDEISSLVFLYNKNKNKKGRLNKEQNKELRSYILQNLKKTLSSKGFRKEWEVFKNWVLSSDLYNELDMILVPEDVEDEYIICKETNLWGRDIFVEYAERKSEKKITIKKLKIYPDKRSMIKVIVLNILYGGTTNRCEEFHRFYQKFPKLCEVLDLIKIYNVDALAVWLQQTESKCIIDVVTKKIALLYPEMPLFTIHDSIATTRSWSEKVDLAYIISHMIEDEIGFKPIVCKEDFCAECSQLEIG